MATKLSGSFSKTTYTDSRYQAFPTNLLHLPGGTFVFARIFGYCTTNGGAIVSEAFDVWPSIWEDQLPSLLERTVLEL